MVQGILSDNNIEGHIRALVRVLMGPTWQDVWTHLGLSLYTFSDFRLDRNVPDAILWQVCQQRQVCLVTANRNNDGPDSLEATLRAQGQADSLPVFTVADADRILRSHAYAARVAERLLEYLLDIDRYLGTGRLYVP
jgi:hypothetical protein